MILLTEAIGKAFYKKMQNFFTAEQKASYEDAFESLHESFGRDVTIIKESKRVIVNTSDSSYNYFYSDNSQGAIEETLVPVSGVFKMRIMWQDPSKELLSSDNGMDVVRPKIHDNLCRIKMRQDAYDFIAGYKQFIVDNRRCDWVGFSKPHGIISTNFYTLILKEVN
jgi:hypothetical protein